MSLTARVKSIFGSPKALQLYKKLKLEHLYVYPEIPICAFVDREQVEHTFSEPWHRGYFLTCRVDFVVCDPDGKPEFVIEYQGGYHQSADQKKKDAFKKMVLAEVGVSVRSVNSAELKSLADV
jgi:hypothetical protein